MTNYLALAACSALWRHPALERRVGKTKQLLDENAKAHWSRINMREKTVNSCWNVSPWCRKTTTTKITLCSLWPHLIFLTLSIHPLTLCSHTSKAIESRREFQTHDLQKPASELHSLGLRVQVMLSQAHSYSSSYTDHLSIWKLLLLCLKAQLHELPPLPPINMASLLYVWEKAAVDSLCSQRINKTENHFLKLLTLHEENWNLTSHFSVEKKKKIIFY